MFEKLKANILFELFLRRRDINKAYAMVGPEDSWYDTITTVHNSLAKIKQLPHENWEITSHDGLSLKAVYYPGTSDKTVIWVHGYTSHAERESAYPGLFYHSMGFNILVPYLRSHGPSEGKYIAFGALESLDIQKWVDKINTRNPNGSILLHGLSMGGGVVLDLAATEMKNVKCLLADAPTVSIADSFRGMAGLVFKKKSEPVLPFLFERFKKQFGFDVNDFDALQIIRECRYPLLLSAGSMEPHGEVFEQLRKYNPMDTTVVILPGCNHGNGMYKQTEMYQTAIKDFIDRFMNGESYV